MKSIITILLGLFICLPVLGADTVKERLDKELFKSKKVLAEKGSPVAQSILGFLYHHGRGVEQDFKEAAKWFRKAAEQGNAVSQFNLGLMYEKGRGVERDFKEAVKWFQKAADQGAAEAQALLGALYAEGRGVMEDNVTAYAWVNIAAVNGLANGKKFKDLIAKKMTAEQITKAEALSKEMIKKNPKLLKK